MASVILGILAITLIGFLIYIVLKINTNILEMKNSFDAMTVTILKDTEEDRRIREMQTKVISNIAKKIGV